MRQALKAVRQIGNTSPLKDILGAELTPGPTVVTDSDWEAWIRNNAATEFHPTATCAMLPEAQGGVVDANLKVYGTCTPPPPQTSCSFSCSFIAANVRVVDGSVFPISFSAHVSYGPRSGNGPLTRTLVKLMASVYGLAEKAAVIIRAAANPSTTSASPSPSISTLSNTGSTKSGASSTSPTTLGWHLVAVFLLTFV
jgi:choline dehydrogenase